MPVVLFSIPLLDIDLGDVHVTEYRAEIFKQGKQFVASLMDGVVSHLWSSCVFSDHTRNQEEEKGGI